MSVIRTFIAINIDNNTRNNISKIQNRFKASQVDIKFVNPNNIHITLLFIGNVRLNQTAEILKLLKISILKIKPFKILPSNLGCFPNNKIPRILWVGIDNGKEHLIELNRQLSSQLKYFYIKEKKDYQPHITIGRIKTNKNAGEIKKILLNPIEQLFQPIEVRSISFMKSTLTQYGPKYGTIAKLDLLSD